MYLKEIMESAKQIPNYKEIMVEWQEIIIKLMNELKMNDPDLYDKFYDKFYCSVYGDHFSEDLAIKAVKCMDNVDGSSGEHWTLEQTTNVAKQFSISFESFNKYDWYYVLNMMYSDYYKLFGSNTDTYVKLAKAWLEDPDVEEGKAYRYYKQVVLKG